jgi:hypothetical protein
MSANLVSSGIENRSLTYFALGGSGIRALEPLLHLCALGLGPRQLGVILIDPDQSNAAVTRSRALLDLYRRTRQAITSGAAPTDGYFRTELIDAVPGTLLWSPIADDEHMANSQFAARVDRPLMNGGADRLGKLFDLLYSDRMARMDMTLGFRGVPSIGTIFMNRLRDEKFFEQVLVNAQSNADALFFAAGSVFGGTGAAGLPVVGRSLVDGFEGDHSRTGVRGIPANRVGAALLMPYFTLPAPDNRAARDGGVRPETALFAQNAAAALPVYLDGQAGYGSYYVVGDSQPREQERNEVGGQAQQNASHYVELFVSLAALDFAARGGEQQGESLPAFRMTAVDSKNVRWSDLPLDEASKRRLMGGLVAAHTFLTHFRPDGKSHSNLDSELRAATWVSLLGLGASDFERHTQAYDHLGQYFSTMWTWLGELRASDPSLELAKANAPSPTAVKLHEIVEGHRPTRRLRGVSRDGMEVFRHWNIAATNYRGMGHEGFLEVMRRGSELFAAERFSETINV